MAFITSIGTSVPPYEMRQNEAKSFVKGLFASSFAQIDRLLTIFENTSIDTRRFSKPKRWFEEEHSFAERNQAYIEMACQLSEEAILRCLAKARVKPKEVDHLIFVSTTGIATPSIDAYLINRLQMNLHVKRTPIWGLGCAGGVAGLVRALEYAKAFPDERVLLVAVELCGLTFRRNDHSKSNLVATSLFGDGAAAVLISGEKVEVRGEVSNLPRYVNSMSTIWPDSLDVMGWDLTDDGLKVIFSKDIPTIVRKKVKPVIEKFLLENGLDINQLEKVISHPGGQKVLLAYEEVFQLPSDYFQLAYDVLRKYGNMSSATVLFVLDEEMKQQHRSGEHGLMMALGPGFSAECLLLQWQPVKYSKTSERKHQLPVLHRQMVRWEVEV